MKIFSGLQSHTNFPPIAFKRRQLGKEPADVFADPISKRRAGHLTEGVRVNRKSQLRIGTQRLSGVKSRDGLGERGGFVVLGEQAEKECLHSRSAVWVSTTCVSGWVDWGLMETHPLTQVVLTTRPLTQAVLTTRPLTQAVLTHLLAST
ncbi:MAG: hypothetical protein K1Y36_27130 [Blastocatellia bacterium]|nr:hypothetical protein [Blastocatellia bacterium]